MKYYFETIQKLLNKNDNGTAVIGNLHFRFYPQENTPDRNNTLIIHRPGYILNGETKPIYPILETILREQIRAGKLLMKTAVTLQEQVFIGPEVCKVYSWRSDIPRNIFSFKQEETLVSMEWLHKCEKLAVEDRKAIAEWTS